MKTRHMWRIIHGQRVRVTICPPLCVNPWAVFKGNVRPKTLGGGRVPKVCSDTPRLSYAE
jgi:hypothetical protein